MSLPLHVKNTRVVRAPSSHRDFVAAPLGPGFKSSANMVIVPRRAAENNRREQILTIPAASVCSAREQLFKQSTPFPRSLTAGAHAIRA